MRGHGPSVLELAELGPSLTRSVPTSRTRSSGAGTICPSSGRCIGRGRPPVQRLHICDDINNTLITLRRVAVRALGDDAADGVRAGWERLSASEDVGKDVPDGVNLVHGAEVLKVVEARAWCAPASPDTPSRFRVVCPVRREHHTAPGMADALGHAMPEVAVSGGKPEQQADRMS